MGHSIKNQNRASLFGFLFDAIYAISLTFLVVFLGTGGSSISLPTVTHATDDANFGNTMKYKSKPCILDPEVDLTGNIVSGTGKATVTNTSKSCSYKVGLASYKEFDENIDNQKLFDSEITTIQPKSTVKLRVEVPECNYQIDLFYGELIESFEGGVRYGDRKLDSEHVNQGAFCEEEPEPEPTPTPTLSPSPEPSPIPSPTPTPTPTPALDSGGGGGGGISRASGFVGIPVSASTPASTPGGVAECIYLRDFLRIDWDNDPIEVLKVQSFLNTFENIPAPLTGIFDQDTFNAVVAFQERYFDDILTPWGHDAGTGFVYLTTRKKINEIYCDKPFPLTPHQLKKIEKFRAFLEQLKAGGSVPSEDNGIIGGTGEEEPESAPEEQDEDLDSRIGEQVGLLDQGEDRNGGDKFLGALTFSSPEEWRRFLLYLLGIAGLMTLWWLLERRRARRVAL